MHQHQSGSVVQLLHSTPLPRETHTRRWIPRESTRARPSFPLGLSLSLSLSLSLTLACVLMRLLPFASLNATVYRCKRLRVCACAWSPAHISTRSTRVTVRGSAACIGVNVRGGLMREWKRERESERERERGGAAKGYPRILRFSSLQHFGYHPLLLGFGIDLFLWKKLKREKLRSIHCRQTSFLLISLLWWIKFPVIII